MLGELLQHSCSRESSRKIFEHFLGQLCDIKSTELCSLSLYTTQAEQDVLLVLMYCMLMPDPASR